MDALLRAYSPFSRLVCRAKSARFKKGSGRQRVSPISAVSVGSLAVGGSEKTPMVIEILRLALELGRRPAMITRGYKGGWEEQGGVLSDGRTLLAGWREAGDEPAMVARRVPRAGIFVGKHRYLSCVKAEAAGFDLAVLDDGFQHLKLARDLDIVLLDADCPGPLREGFSALGRADFLLWKKGGSRARLGKIRSRFPALPVFEYEVKPAGLWRLASGEALPADALLRKRVMTFCGIARPGRFAASVRETGALPVLSLEFPDHHAYPGRSLQRIAAAAGANGVDALITTAKDAVKLSRRLPATLAEQTFVLEAGLALPPDLLSRLRSLIGAFPRGGERP
jgi:tetraacyldisaccharide 4'-kinase